MSSNNIKILSVHKAGSVLQNKICREINSILRENRILFSRLKINTEITNKNDIIVLRHPLNTLISEYYSYGWSHTTKYFTEDQFKRRNKIRQQSLDQYIISHQRTTNYLYNKVFNEAKTIIKYEDIMDQPQQYLRFVLKKIDKEKIFDELWVGLKHEFEFNGKDLSEDIIAERSKSHIRNLDHLEYQKKISPATLKQLAPKTIETIKIYNTLPNII